MPATILSTILGTMYMMYYCMYYMMYCMYYMMYFNVLTLVLLVAANAITTVVKMLVIYSAKQLTYCHVKVLIIDSTENALWMNFFTALIKS